MRKLVVGIVAVVILQIGFLIYVGSQGPLDTVARVVKNSSPEFTQRARVTEPAEDDLPLPTSTPVSGSQRAVAATKPERFERDMRPNVTQRTVDSLEQPALDQRPVKKERTNSQDYAVSRPARNLIPKGHTMVLVDYLPVKSERTPAKQRPRPEVSPRVQYAAASFPTTEKKGSFLGRTFSPIVKKPWKWMKSLASKLD